MEIEQTCTYLPEELVEKIIAMMPFPTIFKAKTLSKSWMTRFSPLESQDDESKKLASRFQTLVSERSHSWDVFHPFRLRPYVDEESEAYDWALDRWRTLPSTGFLWRSILSESDLLLCRELLMSESEVSLDGNPPTVCELHMEGALFLFCIKRPYSPEEHLYVANILTRSWKQLPPRPNSDETKLQDANTIIHTSPQTYKVVLFSGHKYQHGCSVQIYDSESHAWSSKKLENQYGDLTKPVHVNGILYTVGNFSFPLAMHVENWTLEELDDLQIQDSQIADFRVWKGKLLITLVGDCSIGVPDAFQVLGFDGVTRKWGEVARGPPDSLAVGVIHTAPITHGDTILFGFEEDGGRVLQYNLKEDVWDLCPSRGYTSYFDGDEWIDLLFQPGLNPFMPA